MFEKDLKKHQEDIGKLSGQHELPDDEKGRVFKAFEKDIFVNLIEIDRLEVLREMQDDLQNEGDNSGLN